MKKVALFIISLLLIFSTAFPTSIKPDNAPTIQIGGTVNPEYTQYLKDLENDDTEKYGAIIPRPILDEPIQANTTTPPTMASAPSFDPRTGGNIMTPVKDQGANGTCWAFTGIALAETLVRLKTNETRAFSEEHARFFLSNANPSSGHLRGPDAGGWEDSVLTYLMNQNGAVPNSVMPYTPTPNASTPGNLHTAPISTVFSGTRTLQMNDRNAVKAAITEFGAVSMGYRHDDAYYNATNNAYFNNSNLYANHNVTVVGWDDNYANTHFLPFPRRPLQNGAWLIKNSWGISWGNGGYFWLSYFDTTIESRGFAIESHADFDPTRKVAHWDNSITGSHIFSPDSNDIFAANIFNIPAAVAASHSVQEVMFYSQIQQTYEIFLASTSGNTIPRDLGTSYASGTSHAGWNTIQLNRQFVANTSRYAVAIKFSDRAGMEWGDGVLVRPNMPSGRSFFSINGTSWNDLRPQLNLMARTGGDPSLSHHGHFQIKAILYSKTPQITLAPPTIQSVVRSVTQNVVTIGGLPKPEDNHQIEYGISTTNNAATVTRWQLPTDDAAAFSPGELVMSIRFSGLSANTTYYVFARTRENHIYTQSAAIAIGSFKTERKESGNWISENPIAVAIAAGAVLIALGIALPVARRRKPKQQTSRRQPSNRQQYH
jgi:C1A family cysteine protease